MSLAVAALAWLAFLASRVLRRWRVPELVGFLLAGAAVGPSGLGLVEQDELRSLAGVSALALAVLMFLVGERVSLRSLRQERWVWSAGVVQYVVCGGLVYVAIRWAGAEGDVALLLAALAGGGAPMTLASLTSGDRGGRFGRALVGSHAVADALTAVTFAAVVPLVRLVSVPGVSEARALLRFVRLGIGGALVGLCLGWVVARMTRRSAGSGELLALALITCVVASAVSSSLGISLPLAALVSGAVAASLSRPSQSERLFSAVRGVEHPLYLLFFGLAGASIHLESLPHIGAVGGAYVAARVVAKLAGASLGARLGGAAWPLSRRVAVGHLPQAGVVVGLVTLAAELLPGPGAEAAAVVLGAVVVFELAGPLAVARALAPGEAKAGVAAANGAGGTETRLLVVLLGPRLGGQAGAIARAWEESGGEVVVVAPGGPDGTDGELEAFVLDKAAEVAPELVVVAVDGQLGVGTGASTLASLAPARALAASLGPPVIVATAGDDGDAGRPPAPAGP
jgi:Kef-type K+ transport system membrane component KefB